MGSWVYELRRFSEDCKIDVIAHHEKLFNERITSVKSDKKCVPLPPPPPAPPYPFACTPHHHPFACTNTASTPILTCPLLSLIVGGKGIAEHFWENLVSRGSSKS